MCIGLYINVVIGCLPCCVIASEKLFWLYPFAVFKPFLTFVGAFGDCFLCWKRSKRESGAFVPDELFRSCTRSCKSHKRIWNTIATVSGKQYAVNSTQFITLSTEYWILNTKMGRPQIRGWARRPASAFINRNFGKKVLWACLLLPFVVILRAVSRAFIYCLHNA